LEADVFNRIKIHKGQQLTNDQFVFDLKYDNSACCYLRLSKIINHKGSCYFYNIVFDGTVMTFQQLYQLLRQKLNKIEERKNDFKNLEMICHLLPKGIDNIVKGYL
jgi:hypothetical protein